jgi:hypothetical protein
MGRRGWLAVVLALLVAPMSARAQPVASCSGAETWTKTGEDVFAGPSVLTRSQGVTHFAEGWVFSWQGGLERTDAGYHTLALATWPPDDVSGVHLRRNSNHVGGTHIGDVDQDHGVIYAPLEDGSEGEGPVNVNVPPYRQPRVALYDARTLLWTGTTYSLPRYLQRDGVPWIAIDHEAREAYTGEWNMPDDRLNVWTLSMRLVKTLPLHYPASFGATFHLSRIQGGEVLGRALYVARDDDDHTIFKIDLVTGDVTNEFAVGGAEPSELEGLAVYPTPDGALIHVLLITDNDFSNPVNFAKVRAHFMHYARTCAA